MFNIENNKTDKSAKINLSGSMTIQNIGEFKESVTGVLKESKKIIIDQTDVECFDITYLQLLISLKKSLIKAGNEFILIGINNSSFISFQSECGAKLNLELDESGIYSEGK